MIIVSNRLPISVKKINGKLEFDRSIGGLATGLASYTKNPRNKWIGWPGITAEDLTAAEREKINAELAKHNCYAVFLSRKDVEEFYNGYSNEVLWPSFHNIAVPKDKRDRHWNAYLRVNQLFTDVALGLTQPQSTVWIHDYHLLLVPELIRKERPYDIIGFFLHTPFPEINRFKHLPHAKRLTLGLLGADLVGFHTQPYVKNFLDACEEFRLGDTSNEQVILKERIVRVSNFPLGIDYEKYSEAHRSQEVQRYIQRLKGKYGAYKIILAFDRLDPSKGFLERLKAYEEFLRLNPRLHGKVKMIMIGAPSRTEIEAYKKLKRDIDKLVAKINTTYEKPGWQPVDFIYKTVPFEEVTAFYHIADVAFIAPLRDGMNLMAKEYIAAKANKKGVLILSETAGAAQELTKALLVNPKKPATMVEALSRALTMDVRELQQRLGDMQQHLAQNTVDIWKRTFASALQASPIGIQPVTWRLKDRHYDELLQHFAASERPAIILDYDGVLSPFFDKPSDAKPTAALLKLLAKLAKRVRNNVIIISGRGRAELDEWLGKLPITLAAEHGAAIRPVGKKWQGEPILTSSWKQILLPSLEKYAAKTPGAFVEQKEASLVWHYRQSPPYYAQKNIAILKRVLRPALKAYGLALYSGNMILEVRSLNNANKGKAAKEWLYGTEDFILCIGDDYTDEDMFAVMPDHAFTVKVGRGKTMARYRLDSPAEVSELLKDLEKQPALAPLTAYNRFSEDGPILLEKSS